MPFQRVHPREEVPAVFTEHDLEWVCLHEITVALEIFPIPESGVRAKPALEYVDRPALPVL